MRLKPKKWAIRIDTPLINPSFSQLKYLDVYIDMFMSFYMIVPMPLGAWKSQKAFIFISWLLLFVKKFQLLCKDASIFHLKLGNSHRPNYFLTSTTSTLLGHTYHHNQHVIDDWFLTWKNTANLLQMINFWHREILTFSLIYKFSLFLFLCTFPKLPMCLKNNAFHGCITEVQSQYYKTSSSSCNGPATFKWSVVNPQQDWK